MGATSVNIVRLFYLLICQAAGLAIYFGTKGTTVPVPYGVGILGGLIVGGFFILVEILIRSYSLRGFSTATFGLLVGVACAWLLKVAFASTVALAFRDDPDLAGRATLILDMVLFLSFGFLGSVLALRSSRDDFAFVIPYVRFRQDGSTGQPVVLDADSIMDGRVAGIAHSGFLHGRLIVPRFVLDELQVQANSPNAARRQRAERGLSELERMRGDADLQLSIEDARTVATNETIHARLIQVALLLGGRLMTCDEKLSKVARLRGIEVLNLDELGDALRPRVVVGEKIRLPLVRPGKDEHQAVGYLPDGTMLVVNHASNRLNTTQDVVVISTLQTSAGTMVFGELTDSGATGPGNPHLPGA